MSSFYVLRVLSCLGHSTSVGSEVALSFSLLLGRCTYSVWIFLSVLFHDHRETAIVPLGTAPFESFCAWRDMGLI